MLKSNLNHLFKSLFGLGLISLNCFALDLSEADDGFNFIKSTIKSNDLLFIRLDQNELSESNKNFYSQYQSIACDNILDYQTSSNALVFAAKKADKIFYTVSQGSNQKPISDIAYYNVNFPFRHPFCVTILKDSDLGEECYKLVKACAKNNQKVSDLALLDWYSNSPETNIISKLLNGQATNDLVLSTEERPVIINHLFSRVLSIWRNNIISNQNDYIAFKNLFKDSSWEPLAKIKDPLFENSVFNLMSVYSAYLDQAIASSNLVWGSQIKSDALKLFPKNYALIRAIANYELKIPNPDLNKVNNLNDLACELYQKKYQRPFFDAMFANILAQKKYDSYQVSVEKFIELRNVSLEQFEKYTLLLAKADESEINEIQKYIDRCIFWERQCNSYIAHFLIENKQTAQAQKWLQANLDDKFGAEVHEVAIQRLYAILTEDDNVANVNAFFNMIIAHTNDLNHKLTWLLRKANFEVDHAAPAYAYQTIEMVKGILIEMPEEERQNWFANSSYIRVYSHLKKLLSSDIREEIIPILIKRAKRNDQDKMWYYLQLANLYRCKLNYAQAEAYYNKAMAETKDCNVYLEAAMMQYQLQRFAKSTKFFNKMLETNQLENVVASLSNDWRHNTLAFMHQYNRPINISGLLRKPDDFEDIAKYDNYMGNAYSLFGKYDQATNYFQMGIMADANNFDNYLDLGYQLCRKGNVTKVTKIIDTLNKLEIDKQQRNFLSTDWRYIILYHVSGRPYAIEEYYE